MDMSSKRFKRYHDYWKVYRKNTRATISLGIMLFIILVAVVVPYVIRTDPMEMSRDAFLTPSSEHPMGTDDLGRDAFVRVIYGARVSLFVGFTSSIISVIAGVLVGSVAGYYGGKVDNLLMRICEMFLVLPQFFLALLLVSIFGASIWNIIIVIGLLSWPGTARLVRAEFLTLKERAFVEASISIGMNDRGIIFGEILPNAMSPVITNASLRMARAIILESSLSFLGLGDPSLVSWGKMLKDAQALLSYGWWLPFFPGLAISLTVYALNSIGDGLTDTLNPRFREI